MNTTLKIAAFACLLSTVQIAAAHPGSEGYLHDTRSQVVRNSYGECWRTAQWSKENAIAECDATAPAETVSAAAAVSKDSAPPPVEIKPVPFKVELGTDESFDLNKAELRPDARARLSQLVEQLRGVDYDTIVITGHADRSGPARANQLLSERRANAVHNYLVSEGVPAEKLSSRGKGSSEPVTSKDECDRVERPQLAACLAPDRRVEIRVSGTRSK